MSTTPITTYLSEQQRAMLMQPIDPRRVNKLKGNSYVSQHDVRRWLIRIFGFARFSIDTIAMELCYEQPSSDQSRVSVGYRAQVRLTVNSVDGTKLATYTEWAAGASINQPINMRGDAHDNAMKNAESYAMKRCAVNLGDQFGLGLYDHGNLAAFVGGTLLDGAEPDGISTKDTQVAPEGEDDPQATAGEENQEQPKQNRPDPLPSPQSHQEQRLSLYDEIEKMKVEIASLPPEAQDRLRILWQVNGFPKIADLNMNQIQKLYTEMLPESLADGPATLEGNQQARKAFYGTMDSARADESSYYAPEQ